MRIAKVFVRLDRPCDKIEHYFDLYDQWFHKFVGRGPKILEVGVQFGGSAKLWRDYFGPGTLVTGVDVNPQCEPCDYLELIVMDQGSEESWNNLRDRFGVSYFDIVIEDGSHENRDQIVTLNESFAMLKDGGIYFCEDVHTSYYNGVRVEGGGLESKDSFVEYAKKLADVVNERHTKFALGVGPTPAGPHVRQDLLDRFGHVRGVHFYDSVVVLEKDSPPIFRRVNSDKQRQPPVGTKGNPSPQDFVLKT